jgi:glycosyltransferase involved in cell wall biosynthesis
MIRIYAPTIGNGSLAIVGRGIAGVLENMSLLAGVVSADAPEDDDLIDGADAPIGLVVGHPNFLRAAVGRHTRLIVEYAPNSRHQPMSLLGAMRAAKVDMIITPSDWARRALVESWGDDIPVRVVRHGVDSRFHVLHSTAPNDLFVVGHHASSSPERKGTLELIRAVEAWDDPDVRLRISCSIPVAMEIGHSREFAQSTRCELILPISGRVEQALPWPESAIEQYRSCHVVCQPSRSEGFGIVPLEARACGVPVVMTTCTGHEEHAFLDRDLSPGVRHIDVREDAPMFCEMGGKAPRVDPDLILAALKGARKDYAALKREALDAADSVREKWSWQVQIEPWATKICEEML